MDLFDPREYEPYCRNCTNAQLREVYRKETERAKLHGEDSDSEIVKAARAFAQAARLVAVERGLFLED